MADTAPAIRLDGYQVDLGIFQGPLDLLLHLIRKEEVDIYDVSISRITNQYLEYIELMQTLNLEVAGEFILMAATLIRIKTRLLLPRDESDPDEIDPREELIMALVEYRKFREAGEILRDRALEEESRFAPPSPLGRVEGRVDEYTDVTLFDLVVAFKEVLSARRDETFHEVAAQEVLVEDRMHFIMVFMHDRELATFVDLFADQPSKIVAIVTFIALLELVRSRRIALSQSVPFGDLRVYRGRRFHAERDSVDLIDYKQYETQAVN